MARDGMAGILAAAFVAVIAAAAVVGTARQAADLSWERRLPGWLIALGLAAAAAIVVSAWLAATVRPGSTLGVAVASAGFFIPLVAGWVGWPDSVRAAALAASPLAVAGACHVGMGWADRTRTRPALIAVYVLTVAAVLLHAGGYDPLADPSCRQVCADVAPVAGEVLNTREAVMIAALLTTAAACTGAWALWTVRPPRTPRVIVGGVFAALVLQVVWNLMRVRSFADRGISYERVVLLPWAAAAVLGVTVLHGAAGIRRTRTALDHLVTQLSDPRSVWSSRRRAVRAVHFAVPGEDRWVDQSGVDVLTTGGSPPAQVVLSDEHGPAVRLVLAGGQAAGDVLAGLTPVSRLALRNIQLAAAVQARVAEVRASHRRVVTASDGERLRIERDLHDGAQQRLVSAAFYLSVARSRAAAEAEVLAAAEASVRNVLAQLRTLAHGMFPSILASEGLGAALEELAAASDVPIALELNGTQGLDAQTAMAAYATVMAVVDHATIASGSASATVSIERRGSLLIVLAEADAPGAPRADFTAVADRMGAIGGRLTAAATGSRTEIRAELPCG